MSTYFIEAQCTHCGHEGKHEHTEPEKNYPDAPDCPAATVCCSCGECFDRDEDYVEPGFEARVRATEEIISQDPDASQDLIDAAVDLADQLIEFHEKIKKLKEDVRGYQNTFAYANHPFVPIWGERFGSMLQGWWFKDNQRVRILVDIVDLVIIDQHGNIVT